MKIISVGIREGTICYTGGTIDLLKKKEKAKKMLEVFKKEFGRKRDPPIVLEHIFLGLKISSNVEEEVQSRDCTEESTPKIKEHQEEAIYIPCQKDSESTPIEKDPTQYQIENESNNINTAARSLRRRGTGRGRGRGRSRGRGLRKIINQGDKLQESSPSPSHKAQLEVQTKQENDGRGHQRGRRGYNKDRRMRSRSPISRNRPISPSRKHPRLSNPKRSSRHVHDPRAT